MITTQIQDGIATLTFDMPGRSMNVLEPQSAAAIGAAFEAVVADASVTGIVFASGKSSFIAGADLSQMAEYAVPGVTPQQAVEKIGFLTTLFRRIETCGKPVVAAISGTALGGGLELALACHYRIAANNPAAQFGTPEVKLGLLPGAGGTQRLPRLIGIAASLPLLTQGSSLSAADAKKLGIVHELAEPDQLLAAATRALQEARVKAVAAWDEKGFKLPGGDAYTPANQNLFMVANASAKAASRGNQPAPHAILRCVYEGSKLPIDKALRLELKHFVTLVQGEVAQNMIRTLFFARQSADKLARRSREVAASQVAKLGVLGAGFMGAGVAQVSALAGIDVVLVDRDQAIAQKALDGVVQALDADVKKGRLKQAQRDAAAARLRAGSSAADFSGCELVVEAVVEDVNVKEIVIRQAEAALGDKAIFASNTSALPIDDLAKASLRPSQFIGLHFFSPAAKMALVEVIVGQQTSDETLARALDYVRQIRKTPIVVNDGYGFYTTRCVDAYIREGLRLLADGVDPVVIENSGLAIGMPVGPLSLSDEVGIDVVHHISHFFASRDHGEWAPDRYGIVNGLLDRVVGSERLGRKSGAGFYAYPKDAGKHLDSELLKTLPRSEIQPKPEQVQERLLLAQVIEAARCWADGVIIDAADADLGAVLGWAFPTHLGGPFSVIDNIGASNFVARADVLAHELGSRFLVPARLREFARAGSRFHR